MCIRDRTITDGLGLRYQDDCFMLDVTYQRSFIRDQDIEPDQRFLVNYNLKYLAAYTLPSMASPPRSAKPASTSRRSRTASGRKSFGRRRCGASSAATCRLATRIS